jgi:threonine dehydrogenase-like Zn-dependent dehydrogenase
MNAQPLERTFRVHGRVQGVGFRWWTRREAAALGLRGTVRNQPDGTVQVQAAGAAEALSRLRRRLAEGPPGAVVARVDYAGICGTDVHLQQGRLPIPTPIIMGHEAVGRVEDAGEGVTADVLGRRLAEGDRIVWASNIPCGRCYYCLVLGERTLCPDRRIYGINQRADTWPHLSGGWADVIYLQPGSTIIRIPDEVTSEEVIALGCAGPTTVHGILRLLHIRVGDTVAVQGCGPVGLAAAMYAAAQGAGKIILLGAPASRLGLAEELGIGDLFVDIAEVTEPAERLALVRAETEDRGADVVIEATGVPAAVAEGIDMCRPNGEYLVLGQYTDHGPTPLNPHLITRKQLKLYGSWAFAEGHYIDYVRTLVQLRERYDLARLITPYPLERANEALADVAAGRCTKAVLRP